MRWWVQDYDQDEFISANETPFITRLLGSWLLNMKMKGYPSEGRNASIPTSTSFECHVNSFLHGKMIKPPPSLRALRQEARCRVSALISVGYLPWLWAGITVWGSCWWPWGPRQSARGLPRPRPDRRTSSGGSCRGRSARRRTGSDSQWCTGLQIQKYSV